MYKIRKLNRSDTDFYVLMGPIFGSRSIAKEIGIHVYDDAGKQFFVSIAGGIVVGFASVRGSVISDCYTMLAYRRNGILSSLLIEIMKDMNYAKASCTILSNVIFRRIGFKPIKELKNFTIMEYKKNA